LVIRNPPGLFRIEDLNLIVQRKKKTAFAAVSDRVKGKNLA
jgi:hypothetical protein